MTSHYIITTKNTNLRLKVSYRGGKFFKFEKLNGKLTVLQIQRIGFLFPPKEKDIPLWIDMIKSITITPIEQEKRRLYSQFIDEWFSFYERLIGVQYRFNGADGKALKSIIAYLKAITGDEAQALTLWQALLSSWDKLDDFYKNNADLKFINSQINKILTNVKRTHEKGNNGLSADYLAGIKQDLGAE